MVATVQRDAKRQAKADLFFALYCVLGGRRSIAAVRDLYGRTGAKISQATLENYSREFHWVERVKDFDAQKAEAMQSATLQDAIADDVRQVQIARALQQLAVTEMAKRQQQRDAPAMTGAEIARLAGEGIRWERVIGGKATEIQQVMVDMHGLFVVDLAGLWMQSMEAAHDVYAAHVSDPAVRQQAQMAAASVYGPGVDRLSYQHFRAAGIEASFTGHALRSGDEDDES